MHVYIYIYTYTCVPEIGTCRVGHFRQFGIIKQGESFEGVDETPQTNEMCTISRLELRFGTLCLSTCLQYRIGRGVQRTVASVDFLCLFVCKHPMQENPRQRQPCTAKTISSVQRLGRNLPPKTPKSNCSVCRRTIVALCAIFPCNSASSFIAAKEICLPCLSCCAATTPSSQLQFSRKSPNISSTHPSRDVIFFGQISAKKQELICFLTSEAFKNKHFWHHVT